MSNTFLPTEKKRKLNEQQQKFLDALAHESKGNIKDALAIAGYAETSQSNIVSSLSSPRFSEACRDT